MDITSKAPQTVPVPWVGPPQQRGQSSSVDQRFVNCFFEKIKNPILQQDSLYLIKRPGYSQHTRPPAGNATARGVYQWKGDVYSVFGTKLYKGTTDLGVTLTTSSGRCGICEVRPGATSQYLCINDGVKLYCIAATTGVVTTVTANYPANTGDLVMLDGYFFVVDTSGQLWNCAVDDPTTWDVTYFIVANMLPGIGVGLQRMSNNVIVFTDIHMEYFFDAALSPGSPMQKQESAMKRIGCSSRQSIASTDDTMFWVGSVESSQATVWMVTDTFQEKEIGTEPINRLIEKETTQSNIVGVTLSVSGHTFYLLNLPVAERTFCYDPSTDIWTEWTDTAGTARYPVFAASQGPTGYYVQHTTNGRIYTISSTVYQDDSSNFTVLARTGRMDFDTMRRKFCSSFELVGDKQSSTTNVSVQYSDDDYNTLSTARTFDMSKTRTFSKAWGNFRRRSWQISYAGSNPLRLARFELGMRMGQ